MREYRFNADSVLLVELQSYENQGISIWLEGMPSSSDAVTDVMTVNEPNTYMRDYVIDDGFVSEIHFDRIKQK